MTLSVDVARPQPHRTGASPTASDVRQALRRRSRNQPDGAVQLAVADLARELQVTVRTVQRALRELERLDLLHVSGDRIGRGYPRTYRLLHP